MIPALVVLDACVLYPAPLRDLLMHLALVGLYRARWTLQIHSEWVENLLRNRPELSREYLIRTCNLMNKAIPDSVIDGYEGMIAGLDLPDSNDRHVLAAALYAGAGLIVTFNLKDFPPENLEKHQVRAWHPDDFVMHLAGRDAARVCSAVRRNMAMLTKPSKTVDEYIETVYRQGLPATAAMLGNYKHLIV